ncbi:acyl-CoA reductase [Secundilactobacillus collinoides]|uniref:Acyl-CoA reductase n=1 Tax=Secundilactobacillus collinoides DSM 20515 = JCM 1123 TaxID=1423733 RepID=A0A0R2BFG5_SECCO|nr:acyl-CoA reductase [Secundilactobacillus collinoides]KRM77477.1 Acyl-CoA reductase (LuxC) [Secundilactobacillus collinoides DSM 20515 = JCM 1123]
MFDIFNVPANIRFKDFDKKVYHLDNETYQLRYPILKTSDIKNIILEIKQNRLEYLSQLPISNVITIIDQAITRWTDPSYPQRQLALKLLPVITDYDAETIKLEIKRFIRLFRKKELFRFIENELPQSEILDDFHPQRSGSMVKAFGPEATFQVFSGNIPGLQIWSLIMTTLVKSASLGKTSFSEPLFPVLFTQTIAEIDPQLANCMAIIPWHGGTVSLERIATENTEATIVYGSNKTVQSIRPLVPMSKIFLHYGYKISFSMIGKEALTADLYTQTIKQAVEDVAIYDQQSCLSTQAIFVENHGVITPIMVAKMIAAELANYQTKRKRASLTIEQSSAINRERTKYQLENINGVSVQVFTSTQNTDWTVVYHASPGFSSSPLNRFVHVFQIDHLEDVNQYLKPYQAYLQSCAMAVSPTRLFTLANQLGEIGINRVSALGEITRAKPGWHHDGHFNLLDLLHFIDVEPNAEQMSEKYDPDVE